MAVFVPLPGNVLQRNLAHEDCILVLLNVKVLQIPHYLQLMLWSGEKTGKETVTSGSTHISYCTKMTTVKILIC